MSGHTVTDFVARSRLGSDGKSLSKPMKLTTGNRSRLAFTLAAAVSITLAATPSVFAQAAAETNAASGSAVVPPPDYVIGADDVLSVVFWRDKDLSGEVTVRPDGKISLPLLNDVVAAGFTPEQLRVEIAKRASALVKDPQATVVVKAINSRKVYITGQVEKPGSYVLTTRLSVMQLIAMAGGLREYAKRDRIVVMRLESGREQRYRFDYEKVLEGRDDAQNFDLRPGDTVVVP
jgi:polysaccharide biosynthesis/export protein